MLTSLLLTFSALLLPLALAIPTPETPQKRGVNAGWPYGSEKIRGVNIGGVSALLPLTDIIEPL